ncbi:MAG: hypothetical protein AAGA54_14650 [Myxococcota bacterium]
MSILRTAWNARWLVLAALLLQGTWAAAAGAITVWTTRFILGPYGGDPDGSEALSNLAELIVNNPQLPAGIGMGTLTTAVAAWIAWTLAGGLVFGALAGHPARTCGAMAVQHAGPLIVQGLLHLLATGIGVGLLSLIIAPLPLLPRWLVLLGAAAGLRLARDQVRARICLHALPRPFHPMHTLRGIVDAFTRPARVAATAGLWSLKLGIALGLPLLAVSALGPSEVGPLIRLGGVVGLCVAFLRLACVVRWVGSDHPPADPEAEKTKTSAESA